MGSFPSSSAILSPEHDFELFNLIRAKYDALTALGANDIQIFEAIKLIIDQQQKLNNTHDSNLTHNSYSIQGEVLESKQIKNAHFVILPNEVDDSEKRLKRNKDFFVACGAFHKGSVKANLSLAQSLFVQGIDINFVDQDGWCALMHACGEGHLKVVEWLLEECHAELDFITASDKCTPLWVSCYNGRRDIFQVETVRREKRCYF